MNIRISTLVAYLAVGAITVGLAPTVLAVNENARATPVEVTQSNDNAQSSPAQQVASGRLDEAKQQACERSAQRIQNLFKNVNQRGEGQYNLFEKTQERIRTYYTENELNAENYQQLEANVEQARVAAQNSVQTMVQTSSQFGCDSDDPKGTVNQYKVQVAQKNENLKQYRAALKELLLAVKQAAQVSEAEEQ
ncbi:hypothetical protein EOL96_02410 [Candidatus Saccharibacteria bacterium]|nr:hypothetical protein [Candidatus Saccharibacteria bacterium]